MAAMAVNRPKLPTTKVLAALELAEELGAVEEVDEPMRVDEPAAAPALDRVVTADAEETAEEAAAGALIAPLAIFWKVSKVSLVVGLIANTYECTKGRMSMCHGTVGIYRKRTIPCLQCVPVAQ